MAGNDKLFWEIAVKEEHERFIQRQAVMAVPRKDLPKGSREMDETWACKKKSNGVFRARLVLRDCMQVDGKHDDSKRVVLPVAYVITILIFLALIAIVGWFPDLVNARGAFLFGEWESERENYMEDPKEGWERLYPPGTVWKLMETVCGANLFLKVMDMMIEFARSATDPCLYFQWHPKLYFELWSRSETGDAVPELLRFMSGTGLSCMKAMYRFEFGIEGCVLNTKSRMQSIASLSVMEAELVVPTECMQDLQFEIHVMMEWIDLIYNWSVGGRMRHMEMRMLFWLRELMEEETSTVVPVYDG